MRGEQGPVPGGVFEAHQRGFLASGPDAAKLQFLGQGISRRWMPHCS